MKNQNMGNKITFAIVLFSLGISLVFGLHWFNDQNKVYHLTIATGSPNGEYYAFGQALAKVVSSQEPTIQLKVIESAGSQENQTFLETNRAQLAIMQLNNLTNQSLKVVSPLFPEMFHLIARVDSEIEKVGDLKGKRIALMPKGSGSNVLFWELIKHYGLEEKNFKSVVMLPPQEAYTALKQGKVDALFRVITLGNAGVSELLESGKAHLVAIDQAAALQLFLPYLEANTIPKGAYDGATPVPGEDLPVVSVRAMLVAEKQLNEDIIYKITSVLYDLRNEIVREHPPSALIAKADSIKDMGLLFHPGATRFYNQDKPSFFVEYAESLALAMSIAILIISGIWQLRSWLQEKQKDRADLYNLELVKLIQQIESSNDLKELELYRTKLFTIFEKVVVDFSCEKISQESFQAFTFPWEVALNTIRHREIVLLNKNPP